MLFAGILSNSGQFLTVNIISFIRSDSNSDSSRTFTAVYLELGANVTIPVSGMQLDKPCSDVLGQIFHACFCIVLVAQEYLKFERTSSKWLLKRFVKSSRTSKICIQAKLFTVILLRSEKIGK